MFFSIIDNGAPLFPVFVFAKKVRGGGGGAVNVLFLHVWIFSKNIRKLHINFFSLKLKFPTLYLCSDRVLSSIPNLASKYDSSILCSFRVMTFSVIFQNFFLEIIN